jgi:hypothetical protein
MKSLVFTYCKLGNLKDAEERQTAALEKYIQIRGVGHRKTVLARNSLVKWDALKKQESDSSEEARI